jgi:hypothetical protein
MVRFITEVIVDVRALHRQFMLLPLSIPDLKWQAAAVQGALVRSADSMAPMPCMVVDHS